MSLLLRCPTCEEYVSDIASHRCDVDMMRRRTCEHQWEKIPVEEPSILMRSICRLCGDRKP